MVSADEVRFTRLVHPTVGRFPVDTKHPAITTLRHGIYPTERNPGDFPEGGNLRKPEVALIGSNPFSPPGTAS